MLGPYSLATYFRQSRNLCRPANLIFSGVTNLANPSSHTSSAGCLSLDDLLGGGVETQAMTEFYGEFSTGDLATLYFESYALGLLILLSGWLVLVAVLAFFAEIARGVHEQNRQLLRANT